MSDRTEKHLRDDADVQLPWKKSGWFTNERNAEKNPGLEEVVDAAAQGGPAPYGYRVDRPGLAVGPLMHNPYFAFPLGVVFGSFGLFLFGKLDQTIWGWVCLVFFGFGAVVIVGFAIWRIPGWHRARRAARAYISEHGGKMPAELRWYT